MLQLVVASRQNEGSSEQVLSTCSVGANLARRFNAGIRWLPVLVVATIELRPGSNVATRRGHFVAFSGLEESVGKRRPAENKDRLEFDP